MSIAMKKLANFRIPNSPFSILHSPLILLLLFASPLFAQSGSLMGTSALTPKQSTQPLKMSQASLLYQAPPRQKIYKEEDLISVRVKSDWIYNNIANNQRKKSIKTSARITKWFKIPDLLAFPVKATDALPEMGGEIDHKTQNQGTLQRKENLNFTIACHVVSVQENGNLIIDGTRSFSIGEESQAIHICGIIRPEDIQPDNTISGDRVSELTITEIPAGNVADTFRRPWGTRLMEQWKPF